MYVRALPSLHDPGVCGPSLRDPGVCGPLLRDPGVCFCQTMLESDRRHVLLSVCPSVTNW